MQSTIGKLRWPVKLFRRDQIPDSVSAAILENVAEAQRLYANIEPLRPMTFYAGINAEPAAAPTHLIETRWLDGIDVRHAFVRETKRRDGTPRIEVFRVRRAMGDVDGKKARSRFEVQLETSE